MVAINGAVPKDLMSMAKKIKKIQCDPAPFIRLGKQIGELLLRIPDKLLRLK
jgi:hypothetical protein